VGVSNPVVSEWYQRSHAKGVVRNGLLKEGAVGGLAWLEIGLVKEGWHSSSAGGLQPGKRHDLRRSADAPTHTFVLAASQAPLVNAPLTPRES
jgi:hypothetical protein